MTTNRLRRAFLLACCTLAAMLTACGGGSGDIVSSFTPNRAVSFGDGFGDMGQGGSRYTVNDGSINIWSHQVAASYGQTLTPAVNGGFAYARGNARVTSKPDAAGSNATPTITEQIDTFLSSHSFTANDLVLVSGGISDIVVGMQAVSAGTLSNDQFISNARQAGRELGAQVRRIVNSGAKHVLVVGPYNMGKSPWAIGIGQTDLLTQASSRFNEDLLTSIVDLGASVLYVDAVLQFNLFANSPASYQLVDVVSIVCTSVDSGPGIGIGAGQVNSALCNSGTISGNVDYGTFLFADKLYPTPRAHRLFGEYAYLRIKSRW